MSFRHHARGFGLIEAVIVTAIIGVSMYAAISAFGELQKAAIHTEQKANVQNLASSLQSVLSESELCQKVLLSGDPIQFTPPNIVPIDVTIQAPQSNRPLASAGQQVGNGLRIQSVQLLPTQDLGFVQNGANQEGRVLANLSIIVEKDLGTNEAPSKRSSRGPNQFRPQIIPLLLNTDAASSGPITITGCRGISGGGNEGLPGPAGPPGQDGSPPGEALCLTLGGLWIPQENRCAMERTFYLGKNSCIDLERSQLTILECSYQLQGGYGNRFRTWYCSNVQRYPSNQCVCDNDTEGWTVKYKTNSGSGGTVKRTCTGGVLIGRRDPRISILEFKEELSHLQLGLEEPSTSSTSPTEWQKAEGLASVQECLYEAVSDRFLPCDQSKALEGGVNSCVFVKGIRIAASYVTEYNREIVANNAATQADEPVIDPNNYTGWIRVISQRGTVLDYDRATRLYTTRIREAVGRPCFNVKVFNGSVGTLGDPGQSAPTAETIDTEASKVSHCVYHDESAFPLQADPLLTSPNLQTKVCNQEDLTMSSVYPELPDDMGDSAIQAGSCWYVNEINIGKYHNKFFPSGNIVTSKYTGWVYFTSRPSATHLKRLEKDPNTGGFKQKAGPLVLLNTAVPCNTGVRKTLE